MKQGIKEKDITLWKMKIMKITMKTRKDPANLMN